MRGAVILLAAMGANASAAPTVISGTVVTSRSSWNGDTIITTSELRDARGEVATVVQLGGVVDGIGMSFSHQPALLRDGDEVTLEVSSTASGVLELLDVEPHAAVVPQVGAARYGVQRTTRSSRPLWHASGCLEIAYDATSIPLDSARLLDAAFAAWTTAAIGCGTLSFTSDRRPGVPTARDGKSTVHIRRDRWCRPASASAPELCYSPTASAVTRLVFIDDPLDPDDGKILEADLELNAVDFVWIAPGENAPATTKPVLSLQAVATHEAGHVLGLAHNCGTGREPWPSDHADQPVPSCESAGPEVLAATMYYSIDPLDPSVITVEASDASGACALARGLACDASIEGGCSAGGSSARVWIALLLLGLARSLRRRRT